MIITLDQVVCYFLIFARLLGMLMLAPVFNRKEIFALSKVAFLFWLSGLLIFVVPMAVHPPASPVAMVIAVVMEFMVGAMLGFITDMIVVGLEAAGTLMDTQAGLSVASILDPSSGRSITIISSLLKWVAIVVFLMLDGHHMLLSAVVQSFKLLPIGAPFNIPQAAWYVVGLGGDIFYIAVQLSAPIMLVVFLIDFVFGMLSRVAPQVNVFQLGFQIKPLISLLIFLAIVPGISGSVSSLLERVTDYILHAFYLLQLPPTMGLGG
ncbi:MAG: flagellar biosynthetic protein FliR [Candidatus Margulisiibacteriota bacterium]